jgi:hypothetical protein
MRKRCPVCDTRLSRFVYGGMCHWGCGFCDFVEIVR